MTATALGATETWADHGTPVWASRKDISDGERIAAQGIYAEVSARFVVRSSTFTRDLTPKDALVCEGRTFRILGIKELGRRDFLEITATARADL